MEIQLISKIKSVLIIFSSYTAHELEAVKQKDKENNTFSVTAFPQWCPVTPPQWRLNSSNSNEGREPDWSIQGAMRAGTAGKTCWKPHTKWKRQVESFRLCENLPPCPLGGKEFGPSHRPPCASALLSGWTFHIMKMLCQLSLFPQATDCEQMPL